jgi:hypothetical protein
MSTNYYYLLFTTIRSDLMRKRRILEENLKKKWWLKKEQAVCMIWLPKLLWWPKLTTNLYKKLWWQVRLYYCNLVHQTNWQKILHQNICSQLKLKQEKWHLKTKNRKKPKLYDTASYCVWVYLVIFVNKSCFQKTRSLWFIRINLLKL